jgi:hypothetical protein
MALRISLSGVPGDSLRPGVGGVQDLRLMRARPSDATDCRRYRGEFVVGKVNRRHGLIIVIISIIVIIGAPTSCRCRRLGLFVPDSLSAGRR